MSARSAMCSWPSTTARINSGFFGSFRLNISDRKRTWYSLVTPPNLDSIASSHSMASVDASTSSSRSSRTLAAMPLAKASRSLLRTESRTESPVLASTAVPLLLLGAAAAPLSAPAVFTAFVSGASGGSSRGRFSPAPCGFTSALTSALNSALTSALNSVALASGFLLSCLHFCTKNSAASATSVSATLLSLKTVLPSFVLARILSFLLASCPLSCRSKSLAMGQSCRVSASISVVFSSLHLASDRSIGRRRLAAAAEGAAVRTQCLV
mmetsp:Transcript_14412/g.46105  ORF Transcript_14412/g.46105 Transcript_14412/m.46105 type:complete len:268 (+) Transcript_14412:1063-1866(+)